MTWFGFGGLDESGGDAVAVNDLSGTDVVTFTPDFTDPLDGTGPNDTERRLRPGVALLLQAAQAVRPMRQHEVLPRAPRIISADGVGHNLQRVDVHDVALGAVVGRLPDVRLDPLVLVEPLVIVEESVRDGKEPDPLPVSRDAGRAGDLDVLLGRRRVRSDDDQRLYRLYPRHGSPTGRTL